ncbi:MAG: DsbA family protein [Myxococcota bacterium]
MGVTIVHYFDYKSPYAYLAQEPTRQLANSLGIEIDWLPYGLDIPSFLGAAELDEEGRDVVGKRTPRQWRRVRYAYMDCRREATRRGLVIRGPRKIFDSSVAHIGMLYAKARGDFRPYHDRVYARFWRRELDIEDPERIRDVLGEAGADTADFFGFLEGEGRELYDRIQGEAEEKGVFGVPSYLLGDELFFGNERIERLRERLTAG